MSQSGPPRLVPHPLPTNKFIAWTKIINSTLETGSMMAKELDSIIGCLGHLGLQLILSLGRRSMAVPRRSLNIVEPTPIHGQLLVLV